MRARLRTSKLLLRQAIVWSGGAAWTADRRDRRRRGAPADRERPGDRRPR